MAKLKNAKKTTREYELTGDELATALGVKPEVVVAVNTQSDLNGVKLFRIVTEE
jgi:hypothetical protein